ncbi:MAG: HAD family hydrolase [Deltaproteobacteria bacterium]|nr:HAD family hydrolase [Deltaproteobacteria bacterium]
MKTRDEALALLHEYTKNQSLIKHGLSVEAAMRWYAKHYDCTPDEIEKWGITGLLHDFDYEMYPEPVDPEGHPYKGNQILKDLGYDDDIREAIMGHALYTGVERETLMAKALFAVDELSGLVTASTLVRPDKSLHTLTSKSVKKKMKDKHFAAGCNRDDIRIGAEELGVDMTEHIDNVIAGMREIAEELGLAGE